MKVKKNLAFILGEGRKRKGGEGKGKSGRESQDGKRICMKVTKFRRGILWSYFASIKSELDFLRAFCALSMLFIHILLYLMVLEKIKN